MKIRRDRRQRGQATVEFAMVLPFVLTALLAVVQVAVADTTKTDLPFVGLLFPDPTLTSAVVMRVER